MQWWDTRGLHVSTTCSSSYPDPSCSQCAQGLGLSPMGGEPTERCSSVSASQQRRGVITTATRVYWINVLTVLCFSVFALDSCLLLASLFPFLCFSSLLHSEWSSHQYCGKFQLFSKTCLAVPISTLSVWKGETQETDLPQLSIFLVTTAVWVAEHQHLYWAVLPILFLSLPASCYLC